MFHIDSLIFQIAIIVLATKLAGSLSVKLGQSAVLGKLLIGIVLGPAMLGLINDTEILNELSEIGVIILMFIAGLETDVDEFKRTGKSAVGVGILGIVFPMIAGTLAGFAFDFSLNESLFLGLLLSATSVSISVQVLKDMNRLKSPEGSTILGAAVIDDVLVMIALAFLMSFAGGDASLSAVVIKKFAFFAIAIVIGLKVVPWIFSKLVNLKAAETVISASFIIMFVYAYVADIAGVATIIGSYMAGIFLSFTKYRHEIFEKVETVGYSIFIPVFFTSIGVKVSFEGVSENIVLITVLSVLAIVTKLLGGYIGARVTGFSNRSALGIGSAMVSRGEVALIIASIGVTASLIDDAMFAVVVIVVLVTTIITPILMKLFFAEPKEQKA
ncbi:MAG: cation:proton antiporter [Bacilli bacterium]